MDNMEYTNVSEFDRLRKELLAYTDKGIGYVQELLAEKDLTECVRLAESQLVYSQTILMNNVVPVATLAPSGNGKSTTVTGMLDGRNAVPCAKGSGGLRTSSLPLTIYHDPNNTTIKISRYSNEELVNRVLEVAAVYLDRERTEPYDLDDPADYELLHKAVEKEIKVYQERMTYELGRLDMLRNAILILHFYGREAHRQLCAGEFTSLDDVKPFLSFRTDLEKCWAGLRTHGFDLMNERDENDRLLFGEMENLHVFVRDITIPVHSEFMEVTGTAVIDAPGTMMSTEDTRRALKAASEAAVVLFILRGESQLTSADKELLRTLYSAGLSDKVLFAVNFRKPVEEIRNGGIEDAILAAVREAGYCAPHHQMLLYYNALLAVRAAQGRLILSGDLDPDTEAVIFQDAQTINPRKTFDTARDAWEYITRRALLLVDEDTSDELAANGLCPEIIRQIEQTSNWNETVQKLREFVLRNRAAGVLNDLGAQPIRKVLTSIEDALAMYEQDNQRSEEDAKASYEAAKTRLDAYSEEVDRVLAANFDEQIDQAIANDYFDNVLMAAIPDVASEVAEAVYNENGLMNTLAVVGKKLVKAGVNLVNWVGRKFGRDGILADREVQDVQQRCATIIKNQLDKTVAEKATQWNAGLCDTVLYERAVKKPIQRVKESLISLWEKHGFKDDDMLRNADAIEVDITGDLSKDVVTIKQLYESLDANVDAKINVSPAVKGLLAGAGVYFGGMFWYLFLMPLNFILPGLGPILMVAFAVVSTIVATLSKHAKEKQIDKIRGGLEKSLRDGIAKNREESIQRIIEGRVDEKGEKIPGVRVYRELYEDAFRVMTNKHYVDLKNAYDRTRQILGLRREERMRVAALAKVWRTEKIKPLREGVDATIEEVKRIWG